MELPWLSCLQNSVYALNIVLPHSPHMALYEHPWLASDTMISKADNSCPHAVSTIL